MENGEYYTGLFDFLALKGKLADIEVMNLLRESYINLNKLKGDSTKNCLFPKCRTKGVEGSHLFAQGFLQYFKENGKFYVKSYYPGATMPNYAIEEVGIKEVMTFPGFCQKCEKKFHFEPNKIFTNRYDYFLQLFRTVCYEKRILEAEIVSIKEIMQKVNEKSTQKAQKYLNHTSVRLKSMNGANDIELYLKYRNLQLIKELRKLDEIYAFMVKVYKKKAALKIMVLKFNRAMPIFAGYIGNLRFRVDDQDIKSNVVLNIHPISTSETEIFYIDFNDQLKKKHISKFNEQDFTHLFGEIMICSNNWIVQKSYWGLLDSETKNKILSSRR